MLFDLRGRGRRRTVQVIYLGLALIFLLGFIGFGVGVGGSGGGLFNALTENSGSSSASFAAKVASAQTRVKREPNNPKAWVALTEAQLHQSAEAEYLDPATGQFTSKGKQYLNQVSQSWNTYLKLQPHNPNSTLAQRMLNVYGQEGLNQPAEEVAVLQLVIPTKPLSAALYEKLAAYAYKANNPSQGDLATRKALSLVPKAQRAQLKASLEAIKANPSGTSSSATGTSGTSAPSGTYTTTINGKKTVLKASGGTSTGSSTSSATK